MQRSHSLRQAAMLAFLASNCLAVSDQITVEEWGDTRCDLVAPEHREPCVAAHVQLGIPPNQTRASAAAETAPAERQDAPEIARAKTILAEGLKDPTSVLYKDVVFVQEKNAVCGQFNAKNEFGGYAGFAKFTVGSDNRAKTYTGRMCKGVANNLQLACLFREKAHLDAIQANCSSLWPED